MYILKIGKNFHCMSRM